MGDAGGDVDKFSGKFGGVGKAIGGVLAGGAILKFGSDSVAAFTESAQAQSKLELALKNSSATVGVHASEFAKLNSQLAKHTLVDDDVIAATEAQMVTFGASKNQIQQMIPTVLDFAAKMGIDAPEAADLFDKASMGSVKALKTLGIEGYAPTGDKANDLANIQGLLRDKVKGAAQAQLDAAGPGAQIKKSMDELQESVGKLLVPALTKLSDIGATVTDWLTNLSDPVKVTIGVVGGLAAAVWAVNTATEAWKAITLAMTAVQAALNLVMDANPIVLVGLAIAGIGAALVVAYQHSETFRDIVKGSFQAVVNAIGDAVGWILDGVGKIIGTWAKMAEAATHIPVIGDKFKGVADTLRDAQHSVEDWADAAHKGINIVTDDADKLAALFQKMPGAPGGTGPVPGLKQIRGFAAGGTVPGPIGAPMLAMVHGGETITPPGQVGGGGVTINVQSLDPRGAADAVMSAILEYEQVNGSTWRNR